MRSARINAAITESRRFIETTRTTCCMDFVIRPAAQDDLDALWQFLAIAAYEPDAAAAKAVPVVAAHLAGWQRDGDFGFVAERDGVCVGAAWARQFSLNEQPAFYIDERTPELSIGINEDVRGQGIGEKLLRALIAEAVRRGVGLCLNVRHNNPARRLYERVGFRVVPGSAVPNRVSGLSVGMVLASTENAMSKVSFRAIRPARPDDVGAVEAVVHAAYSMYVDRIGKPPGPMLDDYTARIADGSVSVIEDSTATVAGIIVLILEPDHLLLDNIAVRPDLQGQGFGRALIEFAESEVKRLGYAEIRLYTHEKMTENIALYSRIGFVETGRGQQDGYDRVFMAKALG